MRIASRAFVVLASVCLLLALVAGYAQRTVFDADQFANRATHALGDENVRSLIAQRLTDDVVLRRQQDLLAARPLIESTASAGRRQPRPSPACSARRSPTSTGPCSSATRTP